MDLLRHLHLQHLRLPEGKEPEQEHPAAAASGCQKVLGVQRRRGRGVGWVLYRASGLWVGSWGQSQFSAQDAARAGAAYGQVNRLGEAEPALGRVAKSELSPFVPAV